MLIEDLTILEENFDHYTKKYVLKSLRSNPKYVHRKIMSEVEKIILQTVLEITNGNKLKASKILGVNRGNFHKKLKQYNIKYVEEKSDDSKTRSYNSKKP